MSAIAQLSLVGFALTVGRLYADPTAYIVALIAVPIILTRSVFVPHPWWFLGTQAAFLRLAWSVSPAVDLGWLAAAILFLFAATRRPRRDERLWTWLMADSGAAAVCPVFMLAAASANEALGIRPFPQDVAPIAALGAAALAGVVWVATQGIAKTGQVAWWMTLLVVNVMASPGFTAGPRMSHISLLLVAVSLDVSRNAMRAAQLSAAASGATSGATS